MKRNFTSSSISTPFKKSKDETEDSGEKPVRLTGKVKKGSFEHRFERRRYLNQLVQEFQTTPSMECKQQTLANLANFAYDSYNYNFFLEIGVIPVFLAEICVDRNSLLTSFAMAGLSNCAADKRMQKEILKNDGLSLVKKQVYSSSLDITLSAVTTLIYFVCGSVNHEVRDAIKNDSNLLTRITSLNETHHDKRVTNVTQVFLDFLR